MKSILRVYCKVWLSCLAAVVLLTSAFGIISCKTALRKEETVEIDLNQFQESGDYFFFYYQEDPIIEDLFKGDPLITSRIQKLSGLDEENAASLLKTIAHFAEIHGLSLHEALIIVDIESDFIASAYNEGGGAYGLCQVTQPCLDEYNATFGTHLILEDMLDTAMCLDVGFWYYSQILTRYQDRYGYITETSDDTKVRDAYIAYNVGVTTFARVGRDGRNSFRRGVWPVSLYGHESGDVYYPMERFQSKLLAWKEVLADNDTSI